MMACENYREELSALVDGELDPGEEARLLAHVKTCRECRKAMQELEKLSHLVRSLETVAAPSRITDAAMRLVRSEARNSSVPWGARIHEILLGSIWPKLGLEAMGVAAVIALAFLVGRGDLLGGLTGSTASRQTASAEGDNTNNLPPIVEFANANDELSVIRPTPVFVAPNQGAPQAYMVEAGRQVAVIAKSKDGAWAWVQTADDRPAYIQMSDLRPPT